METRANYVLVGIFSVVVLVLGFGFVWWSANVSGDDTQTPLLVRIEGSVTGLSVGSQVLFNGLKVGDVVVAGPDAEARVGNALPLANIPLGTTIHNIELTPGKGGQIVRSAGTSAQLLAKEGDYATVRMPSGEMRRIPMRCMATVGQVSNLDHENQNLGKAGRARHMGQRPEVRGVVMNPRDHPHGGGEGKSPTGMPPKTPWGQPAMGYRTRRSKTTGRLIVRSRHRK